jgi:hypothetical protein
MEKIEDFTLIRSTNAKRNPNMKREPIPEVKQIEKKLIDYTEQELQIELLRETRIIRKTVRWFYGLAIVIIVLSILAFLIIMIQLN